MRNARSELLHHKRDCKVSAMVAETVRDTSLWPA